MIWDLDNKSYKVEPQENASKLVIKIMMEDNDQISCTSPQSSTNKLDENKNIQENDWDDSNDQLKDDGESVKEELKIHWSSNSTTSYEKGENKVYDGKFEHFWCELKKNVEHWIKFDMQVLIFDYFILVLIEKSF